ncbi:hypothetical protein P7266_0628 [Lactococcus cremoris]|nr:hypothetical protein P7266_0628 [Lactococcus cremoris]
MYSYFTLNFQFFQTVMKNKIKRSYFISPFYLLIITTL